MTSAFKRIISILLLSLFFTISACLARQDVPGVPVNLTAEERAWLDAHPDTLTLYFNVEFPPIEFTSETGAFIGMGADVLARVEELLGVTFIRVPSDDWNEHLAALYSGKCAIAPTIFKTVEREEFVYTINLVLLDLNMPGMGGYRCLQELLLLDASVKVIIASGYTANGRGKNTLASGAKGFLGKPYQLKELAAMVRGVLDEDEEQAGAVPG